MNPNSRKITQKSGPVMTEKTFETQQEIDKLEAEIRGIKIEIGEKALELFANGTALDPAIDKLVKKIEAVKDKIEGKQAKIAELKKD